MRYTKNQQDGVEILNDVFVKIFKHIQQHDLAKASFYSWASKIAINTAIDFLRKRRLSIVSIDFDGEEGPIIHEGVLQKLDADTLLAMIRKLPPATQLVFNLYTVDGYNHREIGSMLQISEGTSKWHLAEARKQLQKTIHARLGY
jgi:RNA polymerase sigma factor (sigma-70 family)